MMSGKWGGINKGEDLEGLATEGENQQFGALETKWGKDFKEEESNCQILIMGQVRKNYEVIWK